MVCESTKYPGNKETVKPEQDHLILLHGSIASILPPRGILNKHPNKKFSLTITGENACPQITILPQKQNKERKVQISLNDSSLTNGPFSYCISPKGELSPSDDAFPIFLEKDNQNLGYTCNSIKSSLLEADSLGIIWEATPRGSTSLHITHPSLS